MLIKLISPPRVDPGLCGRFLGGRGWGLKFKLMSWRFWGIILNLSQDIIPDPFREQTLMSLG